MARLFYLGTPTGPGATEVQSGGCSTHAKNPPTASHLEVLVLLLQSVILKAVPCSVREKGRYYQGVFLQQWQYRKGTLSDVRFYIQIN